MNKSKVKNKLLEVQVLNTNKLSPSIKNLIKKANYQTTLAYAPYSNFYVGAALLLSNGKIIGGSNQENASYPLCMCAERVALYTYSSQKRSVSIKAIAITADNPKLDKLEPCMPCGACRQVLLEYEIRQNKPIKLYATSKNSSLTIYSPQSKLLLPHAFDHRSLFKK